MVIFSNLVSRAGKNSPDSVFKRFSSELKSIWRSIRPAAPPAQVTLTERSFPACLYEILHDWKTINRTQSLISDHFFNSKEKNHDWIIFFKVYYEQAWSFINRIYFLSASIRSKRIKIVIIRPGSILKARLTVGIELSWARLLSAHRMRSRATKGRAASQGATETTVSPEAPLWSDANGKASYLFQEMQSRDISFTHPRESKTTHLLTVRFPLAIVALASPPYFYMWDRLRT